MTTLTKTPSYQWYPINKKDIPYNVFKCAI